MKCRELLEPAAVACVECGARVGQSPDGADNAPSLVASAIQLDRNTLSYSETRNNRTFQASLTDTAIQGLGEVLGDFFVQRDALRISNHRPIHKQDLALQPGPADVPPLNTDNHPALASPPPGNAAEKERVLKLFNPNGQTLELTDNRLKAKNGSDFLRRLTYLFLYANELHGRASVPQDQLRTLLQSGKIWDGSGNARRWIAKRVGLANEGEDGVKLTAKGREDAVKALNEALDPSIADEWNPDTKTQRKLGSRKKT